MVENSPNITPIPLGMVNAYLLKGRNGQNVLVDCGVPGSDKIILQRMSKSGVDPASLQLIIVTHGHSDHMGSISALREATGAKTAIHKADAEIIRTGKNPPLHPVKPIGRLFSRMVSDKVNDFLPYEPEIVIDGEMSLHQFGIDGKIIETPGHTNGSISVLLNDGSIMVGDLIMGGMFKKGKPGLPMFADNIEKLHKSIRQVISLSPQWVYTGHGGPFTMGEIQKKLPE